MTALVPLVTFVGVGLLALLVAFAVWDGAKHEQRVDAVLAHLLMFGESYGLDIVGFSHGVLRRGTVYVVLGQLEQQGLLSSREEVTTPAHVGLPRRLYKLTARGRKEAVERRLKGAEVGT